MPVDKKTDEKPKTRLILVEAYALCRRIINDSRELRNLLVADRSAVKNSMLDSGATTTDGTEIEQSVRMTTLARLLALVRNSQIIATPTDFTTVQMGLLVTVQITDINAPKGKRAAGELLTFLVGGESRECSDENPPIFSHTVPFVERLIGLRVGQTPEEETIWRGKVVEMRVVRIERFSPPNDQALLDAVLQNAAPAIRRTETHP